MLLWIADGRKICLLAALLLFLIVLRFVMIPVEPTSSGNSPDRIRGSVGPVCKKKFAEFTRIAGFIMKSSTRTSLLEKPEYLAKYFMYDLTAKEALFEMNAWLYENKYTLPLFEDRLAADYKNTKSPKICISVTSARRQGSPFSYVAQAVSSLINRMNFKANKEDLYIHVFNVDSEPDLHSDIEMIKNVVPVTKIKARADLSVGDFPIQSHYHENLDNAQIMRHLHAIGCQYPILIEDDAMAEENWFESILLAIEQLKTREKPDNWFVIKLFVARSFYPQLKARGINSYDPRFNTVAMMINRDETLKFADALENMVTQTIAKRDHSLHFPKDLFLDAYSQKHHLRVEAFEPVIFQHTGIYSSVASRGIDEESVNSWIMFSKYFESEGKPIKFEKSSW